ncbi:MAG: hypothetical protein FWD76_06460, partial [Firmicutes bacterium]|nr:hypothetical protein [Bacillota bacterium]
MYARISWFGYKSGSVDMIHSFTFLDKYFLLDVESGSLFEIDGIAHDLVQKACKEFLTNNQNHPN